MVREHPMEAKTSNTAAKGNTVGLKARMIAALNGSPSTGQQIYDQHDESNHEQQMN
jgi:hypothetical protein